MDIGPSRKEILHDGPNAANGPCTNRKGSRMEATTRVYKISPADGRLNGGSGIKGLDEVNSKDGSAALIHGQNVQNSKNSGGEAKKGVMPNSWVSLFGSIGGISTYTPPTTVGEKIVVTPSEEVISQGVRVWENSLVGQLIDAKLLYPVIYRLIEKIWGRIEMPIITQMENGLICFQFKRLNLIEWILSCGLWHLGGKPMLLQKWIPGIVPETFIFDSVPVWIKLGRIPLELWTDAGLAVVASAIGKPLSFDLATKERRLSYARICVELNVESTMPAEITVNLT